MQVLMTEIIKGNNKIWNDIAPPIIKSLFQFRINQYIMSEMFKNSLQKKETRLIMVLKH